VPFLAAADVSLGVCTSKRADFANDILDLFGLRQYFGFVNGGDTGIRKVNQLACLIKDRVAAKSNALASVAVLWGHGSLEELQAVAPDALLRHPHELLRIAHAG